MNTTTMYREYLEAYTCCWDGYSWAEEFRKMRKAIVWIVRYILRGFLPNAEIAERKYRKVL